MWRTSGQGVPTVLRRGSGVLGVWSVVDLGRFAYLVSGQSGQGPVFLKEYERKGRRERVPSSQRIFERKNNSQQITPFENSKLDSMYF